MEPMCSNYWSSVPWRLCSAIEEAIAIRILCNAMRRGPHLLQLEKGPPSNKDSAQPKTNKQTKPGVSWSLVTGTCLSSLTVIFLLRDFHTFHWLNEREKSHHLTSFQPGFSFYLWIQQTVQHNLNVSGNLTPVPKCSKPNSFYPSSNPFLQDHLQKIIALPSPWLQTLRVCWVYKNTALSLNQINALIHIFFYNITRAVLPLSNFTHEDVKQREVSGLLMITEPGNGRLKFGDHAGLIASHSQPLYYIACP